MKLSELERFRKDTLVRYIANHLYRRDKEITRELERIEWQIKTGEALSRMNKIVELLGQNQSIEKTLALHREYDTAFDDYYSAETSFFSKSI